MAGGELRESVLSRSGADWSGDALRPPAEAERWSTPAPGGAEQGSGVKGKNARGGRVFERNEVKRTTPLRASENNPVERHKRMADVAAVRNEQGHGAPEGSGAEPGWARERNCR